MLSNGRGCRCVEAARIWSTVLGLFVALAVVFNGAFVAAQSDDPFADDESERPTLPEREVVADVEPLLVPVDDFPLPSVFEGTIFDSPPTDGYFADSTTTGTRIDIPLIDMPGTIEVVTEQLIRDQQALSMDDVLRNLGGKAVKLGNSLRPDSFLLAGFEMRSRDFRKNGFLDPTAAPRDLANVERIEAFVGTASALYGGGQPAGVVNIITKKPRAEPHHRLDFRYGSFDLRTTTLDSTGPLSFENANLLYRINLAYGDANSFRDFGFGHRTFIAPAVTWVVSHRTRVTWEGEYLQDRRRFDTGVVAFGGRPDALPIERFLGEPQDFQQFQDLRSSLVLDHEINDCWSLRFGAYSFAGNNLMSGTVPVGAIPTTPLLIRQRRDISEFQEQYHSIIFDLAGEFWSPGNIHHKVLLGTEQGWLMTPDFTAFQSDPGALPSPPFPPPNPLLLNAADPMYGAPDPFTPIFFDSVFAQNRHGIYAQDVFEITPSLKGLAGIRYDRVHQKFDRELFPLPRIRDDQNYERWSPRAGLVFQPVPDVLSTYVSYSESFDMPPGGARITPNPLEPETGRTWEGGIKAKLFDDLTLTASGFHIQKDNHVFDDFRTLRTSQLDIRSQGAEVSLVGRLTPRWSVVGNYAYFDARITHDPARPDRIGNRARNVPYNSGNVWLNYEQQIHECQSIGARLGMVHNGARPGDLDNTFELPSYTRWDAGLYYGYGRLRMDVYLENLFDQRYYTGSEDAFAVFPGAPFNARGTVALVY